MQTILPQNTSPQMAEARLIQMINNVGPGFHPDTDASDYVDIATNKRLFSENQAEEVNKSLETVFRLLDDPYETGLPVAIKLVKESIQKD